MTQGLDLTVFELKHLKQSFYYFVTAVLLIVGATIVLAGIVQQTSYFHLLQQLDSWILYVIMFAATFIYSMESKRELKKINALPDLHEKFNRYKSFFKKRLAWNAVSVCFIGFLFIITLKNVFFYILLIQLLLAPVNYPRKAIVRKELNNDQIVFG